MQDKNSLKSAIKEKPWAEKRNPFNPNPITKLLVLLFLGFTIMNYLPFYSEWAVVLFFSLFFFLNGFRRTALFAPPCFRRPLLCSRVLCAVFYAASLTHPLFLPLSFSPAFFALSCRKLFYENFGCGCNTKLHGLSSYPPMHVYPCCRDVPFFPRLYGREESH